MVTEGGVAVKYITIALPALLVASPVSAIHQQGDYKGSPDYILLGTEPAGNVCESELRFEDRALATIGTWAWESSESSTEDSLTSIVEFYGWVEKDLADEGTTCTEYEPLGSAVDFNNQAFAKLWVATHCPGNPDCEYLLGGLSDPRQSGVHDVVPWVSGAQYTWDRTYMLEGGEFHVALLW